MDDKLERKIFLVDDDPFSLAMYAAFLEGQGFKNTSSFSTGEQMLEKLREEPNIVVLDHQPGHTSGLEILDKIKRHNPNIYVVFVSSQHEKKVAVDAVKAGAFDYITKEADVLVKIKEVMNRIFVVQDYLNKKNPQSSRFFFV